MGHASERSIQLSVYHSQIFSESWNPVYITWMREEAFWPRLWSDSWLRDRLELRNWMLGCAKQPTSQWVVWGEPWNRIIRSLCKYKCYGLCYKKNCWFKLRRYVFNKNMFLPIFLVARFLYKKQMMTKKRWFNRDKWKILIIYAMLLVYSVKLTSLHQAFCPLIQFVTVLQFILKQIMLLVH